MGSTLKSLSLWSLESFGMILICGLLQLATPKKRDLREGIRYGPGSRLAISVVLLLQAPPGQSAFQRHLIF
jgi:hypothetical protein